MRQHNQNVCKTSKKQTDMNAKSKTASHLWMQPTKTTKENVERAKLCKAATEDKSKASRLCI
jgi:hypothetical protein